MKYPEDKQLSQFLEAAGTAVLAYDRRFYELTGRSLGLKQLIGVLAEQATKKRVDAPRDGNVVPLASKVPPGVNAVTLVAEVGSVWFTLAAKIHGQANDQTVMATFQKALEYGLEELSAEAG